MPEPGNPQTLNRYSYVQNSPVRYTDPTGLMEVDEYSRWGQPPPIDLSTYDPQKSRQDTMQQYHDYVSGEGPDERWFGPESDITKDVSCSALLNRVRATVKEGPPYWDAPVYIDLSHTNIDLPLQLLVGFSVFGVEIAKMISTASWPGTAEELSPFAAEILLPKTPQDQRDWIGGYLGSYDKVKVSDMGGGLLLFEGTNRMGRSSGSRVPGIDFSFEQDRSRPGPMGTIIMHFWWFERKP